MFPENCEIEVIWKRGNFCMCLDYFHDGFQKTDHYASYPAIFIQNRV